LISNLPLVKNWDSNCKMKIINKYVEYCELNTTPKDEANHICFDQWHSLKKYEIVSLYSPQKTHNGSQVIPFLKRSFFTGSFACRIFQKKWMCFGILFIFLNFFHIWWSMSCIERWEKSTSRLAFKTKFVCFYCFFCYLQHSNLCHVVWI
jgi:hypothetical protein